ncbi:carbon-nitrogen hydrolase family protein [Sediminicurvatus halobius]|uniref:carbon-nitrogen hydrolase family protein n=1 Tax=Sediminicurvatus halobius TaxID=2182432 RepID=UPI001304D800|nr:carbon-nitrogen hydrolase family protein [Spiribacter halobius]UEX79707.1 carbon-nitrogen hydrolase family protein [Spiribacter halobius]
MSGRWRIAAAQYDIRRPADWDGYVRRIGDWVTEAADADASLLVFPEYGGLELAGLDEREALTAADGFAVVHEHLAAFKALFHDLARGHGLHILAPSVPVRARGGRYRNRAMLFGPHGRLGWQDKLRLTRFETSLDLLEPGEGLTRFATALGGLGIITCYDSEFPDVARALVRAGADTLLAPSCTESVTGFNRVRIGCRARALENQCYTVQASLVGQAPWMPVIDVNHGAAGVFGPPEPGLPGDGLLASGREDEPGWVYADLDTTVLAEIRRHGEVGLHEEWTCAEPGLPDVRQRGGRATPGGGG